MSKRKRIQPVAHKAQDNGDMMIVFADPNVVVPPGWTPIKRGRLEALRRWFQALT